MSRWDAEVASMRRWLWASQWEASFHLAAGNRQRFDDEIENVVVFSRAIGALLRRANVFSSFRWN